MKICFCYDASESCLVAMDHIKQQLNEKDELEFFCAIKMSDNQGKMQKRTAEMKAKLEEAMKSFMVHNAALEQNITSTIVPTKDARQTIVEHVDGVFDMVVLGTRGLSALKRVFLGSVSTHVLNACEKTSVYIISTKVVQDQPKYLLCVDGSEHSKRATDRLGDMLKPTDKVHIVSFYEQPLTLPPDIDAVVATRVYESMRTDLKVKAEAYVKEAAGCLRKHLHLPDESMTASVVETTNVFEGIVEYAKEKEIFTTIVMGSRGLGKFARVAVGSCTNYVLHNGHFPLLVVH